MRSIMILFCVFISASVALAQTPREYKYGSHPKQALDVYMPKGANNRGAPILVMLHGGGWKVGDKRSKNVVDGKLAHWGQRVIFVSVNTRLMPEADPLEQTRDFAKAVAFVQKNAASWGGDVNRMFLMGHSAGAHVAALLSTRQDLQRAAGVRPWDGTVVLDTAALDVEEAAQTNRSGLIQEAFGNDRSFWHDTSPSKHLDRSDPPMFLVCSSQRRVSCQRTEEFASQARARGISVQVLSVPLNHQGINSQLGKQRRYTREVDKWFREHIN